MPEDWMLNCAYNVATILPSDPAEALAVLEIVREIIEKIGRNHTRRRPKRIGGRSGAARRRRASSTVSPAKSPR